MTESHTGSKPHAVHEKEQPAFAASPHPPGQKILPTKIATECVSSNKPVNGRRKADEKNASGETEGRVTGNPRQANPRQAMGRVKLLSSLFSITDEQAMWRVQTQDDHRAFVQLVERWEEPIGRLCARMTGDLHRGEDLKQETFARVFEKRKSFLPTARFSTWLWRIALNLCYDELRQINRRSETPLDAHENAAVSGQREFAAETPGPDVQMAEREEGELVRRALLQLPEIYRGVLVLRHYESLKLREIADILEIPEGTVNSRLAEGLAQLTRILEPQFDERRRRLNPAQTQEAAAVRKRCGNTPDWPTIPPSSAPRGLQMKAVNL